MPRKVMAYLFLAVAAVLGVNAPAIALLPTPAVSLTRLDCGTLNIRDLSLFSDVGDYVGQSATITNSCYLIRHGNDYLLWDTGLDASLVGQQNEVSPRYSLTRTLVDQLKQIGVLPEQINLVAISHHHFDHVGQLPSFPHAKLLIGRADWDVIKSANATTFVNTALFQYWIDGMSVVQAADGDLDIFGDGSVMMLATPGHTPGHHSLLVRLSKTGNVMLTGDLAHFAKNYDRNGVPSFNTSRAETIASFKRFKKLAAALDATVIIQHEKSDIGKLPAFPKAAE